MVYWLHLANTEVGKYFIASTYRGADTQAKKTAFRLLDLLRVITAPAFDREWLEQKLDPLVKSVMKEVETVFPRKQMSIIHHLLSHIKWHIEMTGPLLTTWTFYGERYGRFMRNLAPVENRTITSVANGWAKWNALNPLSGYNYDMELPSYLILDKAIVTPTGKWKVIQPEPGKKEQFFAAIEQKAADGVFESGRGVNLNGLADFKTTDTQGRCLSNNSICMVIFERDGKDLQYIALLAVIWRWKPRVPSAAGEPAQFRYAFFVYAKHTSIAMIDEETKFKLTRVDLDRPAKKGSKEGEFYTMGQIGLLNPILLPVVGLLGQHAGRKYYVIDPDDIPDVD